jgi:type II secretion system protein N
MLRRILFGLGALSWGAACFLAGLYLTFPEDEARDRMMYEFGQWSREEYALSIGDLALWRLSGVALDDVTLYSVKKGRRSKDNPDPPKERSELLHLDSLSLRAALVPLAMGKQAAAFVAEVYGGAIDGQFAQSEEVVELTFDAGDIDLGRLPVDTEQVKVNLLGLLAGEADLTLDQTDVKKSAGFLKLSFEGLGLGPESTVAGFNLPEVVFSKAAVAFEAKEGKLEVTEGVFESEQLDAELTGDIVLNKKLVRSRNRLELIFSLPEDLDKLAQIAPDLKRSRDEDGKYHMNIGGTVLSPTVRFSRAGARRAGSLKGDDGPEIDGETRPRVGGVDPAMSDEERRKAREERIKERRERLRKRREEAEARNPMNNEDRGPDGPEFEDEPMDMPLRDGPGRFQPDGPDGPPDLPPAFPPDLPPDDLPPDFEQME